MNASSENLAARLETAVAAARVSGDPEICADYAIDELAPRAVVSPASAAEAAEVVRFAASEKLAVMACGHRTKLGMGMPPLRYDIALDTTALKGIAHYDPDDLTLSVGAGAGFNDFAVPLYQQKQFLPLSTPFYFESTIGGMVASGVDSALRQTYGTVRDFLLGAEFIDGTGAICKSGGRVVKNVSGYDLHKLLVGSLGSLAVITQVNLRTFPLPPEARGMVASFSSAAKALELARLVRASALSPSSIELLSPELFEIFLEYVSEPDPTEPASAPLTGLFPENSWHLGISVEGHGDVCERYVRDLRELAALAAATSVHVMDFRDSTGPDLWHHIGQAVPRILETAPNAAIFKVAAVPSQHGVLLERLAGIAEQATLRHASMTRASGVIYFALLPQAAGDAELSHLQSAANQVFELCAKNAAPTWLPWSPSSLKKAVNIWGQGRHDLILLRSLKAA
jgi:glycolate oxidase FAD binding subunit